MRVQIPENGFGSIAFQLEGGMYVPESDSPYVLHGMPQPEVDHDCYIECLKDINESFGMATDPESDITCEVAATNLHVLDLPEDQRNVVIFTSTDFSSLTQNIGNAIELAGTGSANPNTCYIYVAYPGNGKSSNLEGDDRKQFKELGRFTYGSVEEGDLQASPHMQSMWRAVDAYFGATPTHVSANTSGARFGLGFAAAAPENTFVDGYFGAPKGLSKDVDYTDLKLLHRQVQSRNERRFDPDYVPGKVTGKTKAEAKPLLSNIYDADDHGKVWRSTYARSASGNFWMNRAGLKGHNDLAQPGDHALLQDMAAFLVRHEALVTIQANIKDDSDVQKNIDECIKYGVKVMNLIPEHLRSESRGVEFLLARGDLDAHTDNPTSRLAAERRGLRSITTFMRLVFSQNPQDMIVTYEHLEQQAA